MSEDEPETIIAPASEPTGVDAGSQRGVSKQQRELDYQERERREFWRMVLSSVVGRREVWGILNACHPFEVKFGLGPSGVPDPQATFMAMGEQQIGLNIFLRLQQMEPEGTQKMLLEHDPRFKKIEPKTRSKKPD